MVATLLLKKSVSCGGNKFKRVLQKFEEELVFLLSVQNRGCCLFLLLWWPKVLGLNAKGNLPLTSHGTELVSFGQAGNDRNEVLLPTALINHLLGLPGDIPAEFSNPVVPSLLRRKRSCSCSSNYTDRAGEGSRHQAVDITVLKSKP